MPPLHTLCMTLALAASVMTSITKPSFAADVGTYRPAASRSVQLPSQCGSDSILIYIHDGASPAEASFLVNGNIRGRLMSMLMSPGWAHIEALETSHTDRPMLLREYGTEHYNYRVVYGYCWEYKNAL